MLFRVMQRLFEESGFDIIETEELNAAPVNYYICAERGREKLRKEKS
jgi:hypothetical protein